jgi:hypothetical protein
MRDFVETYEAMLKYMDREPTPEEVTRKMGGDWAARIDAARDRADEDALANWLDGAPDEPMEDMG